ncbi:MAG: DUF3618 domain-containing protein [Pseudomonadota bacterium]|nr:DUF3618 domain-containing protein [Pseudomonadota bacterium]
MNTRDRIEAESHKDPARLEREIDQQRDNIGDIINALENKLSPGEVLDRVMRSSKGSTGEFARNLGTTVKANPVPALLASVSLLWLYAGRNNPGAASQARAYSRSTSVYSETSDYEGDDIYARGSSPASGAYASGAGYASGGNGSPSDDDHRSFKDRASERAHDLKDRAGESAHGLRDRAGEVRHGMSEKWEDTKSRLGSSASGAKDTIRHQGERAKSGFDHLLNENPMALGAIAIAVGALLGASLPTTEKEHRLMGDASSKARDKAREAASSGYAKVNEKVGQAAEELNREVKDASRDSTRGGNGNGNGNLSESSRSI